MTPDADPERAPYLTTREVADLLRVKERKVYDLAAAGEIPHRRITGKLLFPRAELRAWIEGESGGAAPERPPVLSGSHDPLLDWALRESGCGLSTLLNGSLAGLESFHEGRAALAGLHIPEDGGWNVRAVSALRPANGVLLTWSVRARGLILGSGIGAGMRSFADLRGRRFALRQPGSGGAALFQDLLAKNGMAETDVVAASGLARTESEAAAAVAAGEADAAIGIEAMARRFNLAFLPLMQERFDLLIDRRAYFTAPVQTLLSFARGGVFRDKAAAMGGYDLAEMGVVRWLSR